MAVYPYYRAFMKNVGQTLVPMVAAEVQIFKTGGTVLETVYSDSEGTTEITQPLVTNVDGVVSFFVDPGRIRLDVDLDGTNVISIEDIVADIDNLALPTIGEVPDGDIDSLNKEFTLDATPNPDRLIVYVDGVRLEKVASGPSTGQFSVSQDTITMGQAPSPGQKFVADYWTV